MSLSADIARGPMGGSYRKVELARMEADVAYFQARLELIGEPSTANQNAQRKAFKHLYKKLSSQVAVEKQVHAKAFSVEGLFDG